MSEVRLPDSIACTSEEQNTYTLSKIATANSNLLQSGQILAIGNSLAKVVPALESNKQQSRVLKTMRSKCEDLPRTLDGLLLLKLCRVEFPDEVVEAMISDMHITDVVAEDLLSFTKLTRLDMSDNKTSLEPFGCLPALVELDIQCNAIKEVTIENGFQNLEVLNLSYNCLRSKDVQVISKMQRIRELYLGSNQICSVPPMMDHFSRLEILSLESNNISGQEIFSMLSIMPRLLDLNLSYNQITGFPESALTTENTCGTGFYNLVYLNLAHNTIMNEEAIIHTSKLRSLRKLILYGNPLAHAAITPYDSTKLAYDPVPNLTRLFNERTTDQIATTIVSAYPDTKKKKLHSMSCYEHVEIYKIIPNEVVFQSPFRTRATEIIEADFFKRKMPPSKQQSSFSPTPTRKQLKSKINDSTFMTGVGIEDILLGAGPSTELPAVPASVVARSLAMDSKKYPALNTRMAINALRYQLDHPLTSHDDNLLCLAHSQQLTQTSLQRKHPRRPLPQRKESQILPNHHRNSSHSKLKDYQSVDDALTKVNYQVSSTSARRPRLTDSTEQGVDKALDSLITTAKKLNLTYNHSP